MLGSLKLRVQVDGEAVATMYVVGESYAYQSAINLSRMDGVEHVTIIRHGMVLWRMVRGEATTFSTDNAIPKDNVERCLEAIDELYQAHR